MTPYLARLDRRIRETGTCLCLGLDPDPSALPRGFAPDVTGVERFAALVLDAALPYVAAVKPNLAFFEAFGSAGLAALERLRARIPAGVPVIADAKRGDIGTHGRAPGDRALRRPRRRRRDRQPVPRRRGHRAAARAPRPVRVRPVPDLQSRRGASSRTSRSGADAATGRPAEPLYGRVAAHAARWHERFGTVGLVVGATAPSELAAVRAVAPALAFLVPGVGAQGGDLPAVLEHGPAARGEGRGGRRRRAAGQRVARHRCRGTRPGRRGGGRGDRRPGVVEAARGATITARAARTDRAARQESTRRCPSTSVPASCC